MRWPGLSWARVVAILFKEFRQMRRDRLTFAMLVGVPIMQLVLFGYAINTDPHHLPLAAVVADDSPVARGFVVGLQNSQYFDLVATPASEREGDRLLERGEVQFMVVIPPGFGRQVERGERPALLLAADATDPAAAGNALAALEPIARQVQARELKGPLAQLVPAPGAFEVRIQRRYNPEALSRYNIVPGLIGVILTMTMVMMTSLAVTRETERGTMENLLATPARPVEVMIGKILPYILVGYLQVSLILLAARLLFEVPMLGSLVLLSSALILFIAADLLFLPAVDPAVGLHVPVSRHAALGPGDRRSAAADALPARRARDPVEGERLRADRTQPVADRIVHARGRAGRDAALP
jgi:ABC-2 type transport system permease protein